MGLFSTWWVWIVVAAVLGVVEILSPTFLALGFAVGALGVSGILFLGVAPGPGLLFAIWAVMSLVVWVALRQVFKSPAGDVKTFEHDIND